MTTDEPIPTLATPEMETARGVWGEQRLSHPIGISDIRRWAIGSYWPEKPPPLFWDEEYAKGTKWGGLIAPTDFNPSPGRSTGHHASKVAVVGPGRAG